MLSLSSSKHYPIQVIFTVVLSGLALFCALSFAESHVALAARDLPTLPDLEDDAAQANNVFQKFLNDSRSHFTQALANLSSYLPINVNYTVTVGKECDILTYNKYFYQRIPLILAAALIALGIIYAFFGK